MVEEDYCSYEIAKLLKEKGFIGSCDYQFDIFHEIGQYDITDQSRYPGRYIDAPTLQMAMKWLREEYGLHCDIGYDDLDWSWNIISVSKDVPVEDRPRLIKNGHAGNESYEEACEKAIRYCLENLI